MKHFSPTCLQCPHRQTPLMGCCVKDELDTLASQKSVHFYQKGQTIYQQDAKVTGLYCVYDGKIKLTRMGSDYKEHIVQLARPGDIIGYRALLSGNQYTSSAVALDDSTVCFVPRLDFVGLVQANKQFSNALLHLLATSLGEAEQRLLELAYKPVRERLAGALVVLQRTYGAAEATEPFSISLAREDLAALVGTAKETVSRLLSEFKEAGLIATRGSRITLLKHDILVDIATHYN
ncbi:MAG: Crp/Fnr family transcriptional regulator [Hymenobacter sp.]|nr:MAG: Crp/Fnr family transcriptional regulator [Hymenobacter sp.]